MKNHFIWAVLIALASAAMLPAQTPAPNTASSGAPAAPAGEVAQRASPPAPPPLPKNVTITVKGVFLEDEPVDFALTGAGPTFTYEIKPQDAMKDPVQRFAAAFEKVKGDGYLFECYCTEEVPIVTKLEPTPGSTDQMTTNVNYQALGVTGTVLLKPGIPCVFLNADGKSITLTLTEGEQP